MKDKIDKIGDFVYQELVHKMGKENVVINRKEAPDRMIFL